MAKYPQYPMQYFATKNWNAPANTTFIHDVGRQKGGGGGGAAPSKIAQSRGPQNFLDAEPMLTPVNVMATDHMLMNEISIVY